MSTVCPTPPMLIDVSGAPPTANSTTTRSPPSMQQADSPIVRHSPAAPPLPAVRRREPHCGRGPDCRVGGNLRGELRQRDLPRHQLRLLPKHPLEQQGNQRHVAIARRPRRSASPLIQGLGIQPRRTGLRPVLPPVVRSIGDVFDSPLTTAAKLQPYDLPQPWHQRLAARADQSHPRQPCSDQRRCLPRSRPRTGRPTAP